jgi:hypothetical protein
MATQAEKITTDHDQDAAEIWTNAESRGDHRYGKPRFDRRLSDKILTAYNPAYAADEVELANKLRVLLEEAEGKEIAHCERGGGSVLDVPVRRTSNAVQQARLWSQFVDARQGYVSLSIRAASSETEVRDAFSAMQTSYARWIVS